MSEITEEIVEAGQYLTFVSAGQDYAIPIMRMREIVPYTGSTKVPLAPDAIRGLINLRGRAIPVVDLSVRFGSPETSVTKRTCVLIVDLDEEEDRADVGILAESVSRVIDVAIDELEETPSFGMGVARDCLSGMLRSSGEFIPIIEVVEVLDAEAEFLASLPTASQAMDLSGAEQEPESGAEPEPTVEPAAPEDAEAPDPTPADED